MSRVSGVRVAGLGALVFVVVGAFAGGPAAADPVDRQRQPIINGTPASGDAAVVAIASGRSGSGDVFCTGTLVSPHAVVAAGHCQDAALGIVPREVYFGQDPDQPGGTYVAVDKYVVHPDFEGPTFTNDIMVLFLKEAAPANVQPIALASAPPEVGDALRHVGFGCRAAGGNCGGYGQKYEVTGPITEVNTRYLGYGVGTCDGDSGGPAFALEDGIEVLAGLTLYGDRPCAEYGYDGRIDIQYEWIRGYVETVDPGFIPSLDDGGCGCTVGARERSHGGALPIGLGLFALAAWTRRRRRPA